MTPSASTPAERADEPDRPLDLATDWTPPSWDEVVRTHSARVYRLAYRLTGNPYDAEDLTQDVFVSTRSATMLPTGCRDGNQPRPRLTTTITSTATSSRPSTP